ncbi:MAG TPA: hypothetical protein VGN85_04715 [Methyloceanibacter sp.]|nr:hypothetical protein [Methyloceanibacter sp.]
MTGKLTISIDLELAWGVWDTVTPGRLRLAEEAERPIVAALIALFDRHAIPATWAMVAALLDEKSASARPGPKSCWSRLTSSSGSSPPRHATRSAP